jgi:dihydrofolate reductase
LIWKEMSMGWIALHEFITNQIDGTIYVSGSGTLVRAMLADGLVDDLHLFVSPLALGSGQRLFADAAPPAKFALPSSVAYEGSIRCRQRSMATG